MHKNTQRVTCRSKDSVIVSEYKMNNFINGRNIVETSVPLSIIDPSTAAEDV